MRRKEKIIALVMACALVLTVFTACGADDAKEPTTDPTSGTEDSAPVEPTEGAYIGKVPITLKHDVHGNDAKWAAIYAEEEYGATYEVIDPDNDASKSIAAVETFIGKGVDGIILHPVTEDGVNEIIAEARSADVAIMSYCLDPTGKAVPALLIDEAGVAAEMGADMAEKWQELYPDIPVQVGIVGWTDIAFCFDNRSGPFLDGVKTVTPDSLSTEDRGFKNTAGDVLTGATYWEHGGGDLAKADAVTSAAITKYPEVNVVYGTNVANGLGVLSAYEAAGRGLAVDGNPLTEIIASTDASAGELKALADPTTSLKYALGMQPQTFAYAQIDMIMQIINGDIDPDSYVVQSTPDTYFNYYKDTVDGMQEWFNTQYMPDTPLDLAAEIAK